MKLSSKDTIIILALMILLLALITGQSMYNYKLISEQNEQNEQIIQHLNDSIYQLNDSIITSQAYVGCLDSLLMENKVLFDKVKSLQNQNKINPDVITETKLEIRTDTITIDNISFDSLTYQFNYDNEWINLSGMNRVHRRGLNDSLDIQTRLDKIIIPVHLYSFLYFKDNKIMSAVESSNPYVRLDSIKSAVIDLDKNNTLNNYYKNKYAKSQSRFSLVIGPYVGYGINGFNLGIGVSYGYRIK